MNLQRFLATTAGLALMTGAVAASPATGAMALATVGLLGAMRVTNACNDSRQWCPTIQVSPWESPNLPSDVYALRPDSCQLWDQWRTTGLRDLSAFSPPSSYYYYEDRSGTTCERGQYCDRVKVVTGPQLTNQSLFLYNGSDSSAQTFYSKMYQTGWACGARLAALASSSLGFSPTPTPSPSQVASSSAEPEEEFFDASSEAPWATPAPEEPVKPSLGDGLVGNPDEESTGPDPVTIGLAATVGMVAIAGAVSTYAGLAYAKSQRKKDEHVISPPIPMYDV